MKYDQCKQENYKEATNKPQRYKSSYAILVTEKFYKIINGYQN